MIIRNVDWKRKQITFLLRIWMVLIFTNKLVLACIDGKCFLKYIMNMERNSINKHIYIVVCMPFCLLSSTAMYTWPSKNANQQQIEPTTFFFTFDHLTWNSIKVINSLQASIVPILATSKQRGQQISRGQHLYKDQHFDLDLWSRFLKIHRKHLLSREIFKLCFTLSFMCYL